MKFLKERPVHIFILIIVLFVLFWNNNQISLWDQDEGAYAGFAKNMVETGNWLVPDFTWSEIHRKPPLHFWNIALSYQVFGINEFSVRFPSAMAILLTLIFTFYAGKKLFDQNTSLLGTLVLSTSFLVPFLAKVSVTDATLLFFTTVCAFAIIFVIKQRKFIWSIVFWISFSLALLTKGPPIIIFSVIFVFMLLVFHPNRKNLLILHPWFFFPIACLPLLTWGYLAWQTDNGKFITWMIDWYILRRVGGSVLGQSGPPGLHFLGLMLFFLPYLMFFPKTIGSSFKSIFKDKGDNLLLSSWLISGWLFFELLPSKLPTYIIAAHVPLALLIGKTMYQYQKENQRPAKTFTVIHFILLFTLYAGLIIVPFIIHLPSKFQWFCIIAGIISLTGLILQLVYYKKTGFIVTLLATNLLFMVLIVTLILPSVDSFKNASKLVGQYAGNYAIKESKIVIANQHGHPPSLPFYLGVNFKSVTEEYNPEHLFSFYESSDPYVLILNQEQKDLFIARYPHVEYKEISAIIIDRNQKAAYYIFMNAKARK